MKYMHKTKRDVAYKGASEYVSGAGYVRTPLTRNLATKETSAMEFYEVVASKAARSRFAAPAEARS